MAGALRLSQPQLDGGGFHWLEGRPAEAGRQVVVRLHQGAVEDRSPPDVNVRSTVHEYGGGDYLVRRGVLFFVDAARPGVQRLDGAEARSLSGAVDARYADFDLSPDGRWLACVEELPRPGREPVHRIVALDARGGERRVVAQGFDFYASPRFAPDGRSLVYLGWRHPNMPWDGTELQLVRWSREGVAGPARHIAGGAEESVLQPGFSPGGRLTFVSDRSGWWNLYQLRDGAVHALCPRAAEFAEPPWVFAQSSYAFVDEGTLLCVVGRAGLRRLARLRIGSGQLEELPLPYTLVEGLRATHAEACFVAASPTLAASVCRLSLADGRVEELRTSARLELDPGWLAHPEALEFPSVDGRRAYGFLYRPRSPVFAAPAGARAPLVVSCHGGPTSAAVAALRPEIQFWTTRGFAFVDVNYAGSTGYGRAYRNLLRERWGVADAEDCVAAADHLIADGLADAKRSVIRGSSAGGFTALCALTFHARFAAGASVYGIGDLESLARDTHKFESRYLDRLVGPLPQCRERYRARSPLAHANRLSVPVIFFQGLEDRVVPPAQAEAMVAALARRGIPHAYVRFAGERHGFRRAESLRAALAGELFFYAQVFGFEVEERPELARLRRSPAGRGAW